MAEKEVTTVEELQTEIEQSNEGLGLDGKGTEGEGK